MKKIYTLLLILFTIGISHSQEVMVNGGFENWDDPSTPTGYSKAENTAQESVEVYSGTYSAKHTGGTKDIGQTVPIESGETYTISLWYKFEVAGNARLWSYWKSNSDNLPDDASALRPSSYLDSSGTTWAEYSVTLTAPATADALYFEVRTYGSAVVFWDDFSVVKQAVANPSIAINSPANDDFIAGTDVDVTLSVQNFNVDNVGSGDGHIHYSIDGGDTVMKYDTDPISLTNLSYGEHTLALELVDGNHASLDPAVTASVTFTTYKQQTLPFVEEFDYPDGELSSSDDWTVFSGTGYDVGVVSGKAEVKHVSGQSGKDLFVSIPSVNGAVYYSFDVSVVDPGTGPIAGGDYEYFALLKDDEFNYRARVDIVAPTATGDYTLGLSTKNSTADLSWTSDLTYGQSYRVTVMYDQDSNIAKLWVDASSESDASITGTDEADPGTSITQFALRQSTSSVNETITVDNLKIGQTFASTLSNDDGLHELNLNIYPNPVSSNLNFSGLSSAVQASVYDMTGRLYFQKEVTNTLDVSSLKAGIYMVKIENESGSKIFNILKN
ncbi:MAG: T9SS type A sorting domain-containing protein [Flavobacteriaceae bacterium]